MSEVLSCTVSPPGGMCSKQHLFFVMKCPGVGVGVEYSMTTHPKHLIEKITIMHLIYATYVCNVYCALCHLLGTHFVLYRSQMVQLSLCLN